MRNVTVTLEEEVAEWSRIWAAKHDTSVSRMLGELLKEKMRQDQRYGTAMQDFLALPAVKLNAGKHPAKRPYPSRAALHER